MSEGGKKAAATRRRLLEITADEVLVNGLRATSIDTILENAGVTKGALYYHFESKDELGLAMLDELYRDELIGRWESGLSLTDDPVEDLLSMLRAERAACTEESVLYGCPINNLAQEMASVNETFRIRIESIFEGWRTVIADALNRGKENGTVRAKIDTNRAAIFITSLIEGAKGAGKTANDPNLQHSALETLMLFVETLRPGRHFR